MTPKARRLHLINVGAQISALSLISRHIILMLRMRWCVSAHAAVCSCVMKFGQLEEMLAAECRAARSGSGEPTMAMLQVALLISRIIQLTTAMLQAALLTSHTIQPTTVTHQVAPRTRRKKIGFVGDVQTHDMDGPCIGKGQPF